MAELKSKVALITGAASGIGLDTAKLFGSEGAKLVITDVNEEKINELRDSLTNQGIEVEALVADAADAQDAKKAVDLAVEKFEKLDIAVNNAGISGASLPTGEYSIEDWDKIIKVNLSGVFYGMHYQLPAMEKTTKVGSIVNVASILGQVAFPNAVGYVAAKHGVVGMTKSAALEYSAKGIRINSVGPGFIDTPLLDSLDKDTYDALVDLHPIGRLGKGEEVAELILWLAGNRSSFVTGSYYPVDGGFLAR